MNGTAKLILWIGLFLITMIVVAHWSEVKNTVFQKRSPSSTTPGTLQPGGGLTIPNPLHQFPGGTFLPPTVTVPLSKKK